MKYPSIGGHPGYLLGTLWHVFYDAAAAVIQ